MGHLTSTHRAYKDLRQRLDRTHIGLPEGEALYEILRLLYTREEAEVATAMPVMPVTVGALSRRTGVPEPRLQQLLEHMADIGTVMDIVHPDTGKVRYMLSPPVVGFFEFALMRRREDLDQPALAMAMDAYIRSGSFFEEGRTNVTQIGRTMVHEDALDDEVMTEVLPYERASELLRSSKRIGVSLCYCRHKAEHLGHACDAPQNVCLAINHAVDYLVRHGTAREIDAEEALDLLALSREHGLVQIADNVARRPIYVCNCCGCCCMQLRMINRYGVPTAVHTSNFIAAIDDDRCRGCGRCARRCPVQAISVQAAPREGTRSGAINAVVDEELCLGCGVCHAACRRDALRIDRRARRVLTPQSSLERVVRMALDRGRLQHLLFDEGQGLPTQVANRALGVLLDLPPTRRALANEQIRSRFVAGVIDRFKGGARRRKSTDEVPPIPRSDRPKSHV